MAVHARSLQMVFSVVKLFSIYSSSPAAADDVVNAQMVRMIQRTIVPFVFCPCGMKQMQAFPERKLDKYYFLSLSSCDHFVQTNSSRDSSTTTLLTLIRMCLQNTGLNSALFWTSLCVLWFYQTLPREKRCQKNILLFWTWNLHGECPNWNVMQCFAAMFHFGETLDGNMVLENLANWQDSIKGWGQLLQDIISFYLSALFFCWTLSPVYWSMYCCVAAGVTGLVK